MSPFYPLLGIPQRVKCHILYSVFFLRGGGASLMTSIEKKPFKHLCSFKLTLSAYFQDKCVSNNVDGTIAQQEKVLKMV